MWEVKKRFVSTGHRILPSCGCKAREDVVVKHGAILYNEAEVFSLSITNPNGRPMLPFD